MTEQVFTDLRHATDFIANHIRDKLRERYPHTDWQGQAGSWDFAGGVDDHLQQDGWAKYNQRSTYVAWDSGCFITVWGVGIEGDPEPCFGELEPFGQLETQVADLDTFTNDLLKTVPFEKDYTIKREYDTEDEVAVSLTAAFTTTIGGEASFASEELTQSLTTAYEHHMASLIGGEQTAHVGPVDVDHGQTIKVQRTFQRGKSHQTNKLYGPLKCSIAINSWNQMRLNFKTYGEAQRSFGLPDIRLESSRVSEVDSSTVGTLAVMPVTEYGDG